MDYIYHAALIDDPDGGFLVTFADVPEAITAGGDRNEALLNAADALGVALRGYLAEGLPLPQPRSPGIPVALDVEDAMKLALIEAFAASGITKSELAKRIGKAETEARRILDPDHPTKAATMQAALAVLGKSVVVTVRNAA